MFYLVPALLVYIWTARELLVDGAPATYREVVGGVLACTMVAAAWPLVLIWRGMLGSANPASAR